MKCSLHKIVWWFTGVVDLAVAGFMVTALVYRAQYFPTTLPRCAHSHSSEPIGKLFAYIASVANKNKEYDNIYTPDLACQHFQEEWVYAIMIRYVVD